MQNQLSETACASLWRALHAASANKENIATNEDATNKGRALTSLSIDECPGAFGGAAVPHAPYTWTLDPTQI